MAGWSDGAGGSHRPPRGDDFGDHDLTRVAARPVPLAKTLAALDVLSGGRLVAGVGPGSSERDYDAVGVPFHDRSKRFDEAVTILWALLGQERAPQGTRYFTVPDLALAPAPRQDGGVPLWIGSWGSAAGLRRVARLGDGWLASAYNTTAEQFVSATALLRGELRRQGRPDDNSRTRW